ncbi:MAG: phosphatase PAP2 family protein [Candidatus Eisenbacteria bacterium]|jgi:undecaprenyl-diphosphatase|nr:phosphatase PAP2 family protein [Candidatus Eisenbacteria bacterium]
MNARLLFLLLALSWPWQPFDDAVKAQVQASRRPWLEGPMHAVTNGGRPLLVVAVGAGLLSGAAGRAALLEAGVALIPVNLAVEGIKYATNRERPNGDHNRRNSAFPSSHAANAFAVAVILVRRWRRAAVPALVTAALIAYSRMYLNKHWAVDVMAGAALGAGLAYVTISWWRARAARGSGASAA